MLDKFKIGEGNFGNSAIRCYYDGEQISISENKVSYWVIAYFFDEDISGIIMKDTEAGIRIKELLDITNKYSPAIESYIKKLAFENLKFSDFENLIKGIHIKAHANGRDSLKKAFKSLMDIEE